MYRILDNQWHHLAFAYDETTSDLAIYRDGEGIKPSIEATRSVHQLTAVSIRLCCGR